MEHRIKYKNFKKILMGKYLEHGIDGLLEQEVLELILLGAAPRRDVRSTAGELMGKYSSLKAVLDAPISDLMEFPHIDLASALNIKLMRGCPKPYM